MRAVIIGGMGFLGSAVVRVLLSRGDEVVVVDPHASQELADRKFGPCAVRLVATDMRDRGALTAALRGADEVYHYGGRLGTSELDSDVLAAIEANVSGAVTVFESAIAAGVPAIFYPSKPNVWLNTYTITKVAAEEFARLFAASHPVRIPILRLFNAYGPGQATGPVRKIIPSFTMEALRGQPLTVYGDGEQTVDMIHADDAARLAVALVRGNAPATPVDGGRGIPLTVNEVAEAVNRVAGNRAGIRHVPMRQGETPNTKLVADTGPLRAAVGDFEFVPWESTLADTVEWYRRRYAAELGAA